MKELLKNLFFRFCYWGGIDALFYLLNRHAKRVVTFHNVMPEDQEHFRRTVQELSTRFRFSVDMNDVTTLTITFDDGYCNQYEIAAEVLRQEGNIPAILFGAGRALRAKEPIEALPVDLLGFWADHVPLHVLLEETGFANRRNARVCELYRRFCADTKERGWTVVWQLDRVYSFKTLFSTCDSEWLRLRLTGISEEKLQDLRNRGWVVGWHTENHFPLELLTDEDSRIELTPPAQFSGCPMSYPYGTQREVCERERIITRQMDYPCAFSNVCEPICDKYFRRRFALGGDKYRIHHELSGAKYFFKHRKLLSTF